jgi:hypothetical protein
VPTVARPSSSYAITRALLALGTGAAACLTVWLLLPPEAVAPVYLGGGLLGEFVAIAVLLGSPWLLELIAMRTPTAPPRDHAWTVAPPRTAGIDLTLFFAPFLGAFLIYVLGS